MTNHRWLPAVLRARQATEDVASQRLAQSQIEQQRAEHQVLLESERLDAMTQTDHLTQQAFLAAAAARGAAAATHSATLQRLEFARGDVRMSIEELREAARERRSAQKIAEREAEVRRANLLAVAQRELDDMAITGWRRKEANG